nr:hypothetical protein [Planctomycetota bacterium]
MGHTVGIPSPCHESWDGMSATADGRHCSRCEHTVVDLTDLGPTEARRRLEDLAAQARAGASTCIRTRADGRGRPTWN